MPGVIIFSLSIFGLAIACFLRRQRNLQSQYGKMPYCVVGSDCFTVTSSKYGRTFGVKNEDLGIGYYLIVSGTLIFQLFVPTYQALTFLVTNSLSLGAAVFSIFLLATQIFILKKYCFMCLLSLGINLAIFAVSWIYLLN